MAIYGYEAAERSGKVVKGSLEANSRDAVKAELKKQGLTVIKITDQNLLTRDINIEIGGKPTIRDLSVFCRQFVSITKAGVSILEALKMLMEQTENRKLQKAIAAVKAEVEKGETLAKSLEEHPKIFPSLLINMVAAGEASGNLDVAFDRVATQLEKNHKTQSLVKKAMIYPIVLACVALAVVIVMLVFVIPSYTTMFNDLGTELPGITKAVVAVSDFIIGKWYLILIVVGIVVFGISQYFKTESGEHFWGKFVLCIPAVRNLITKSSSSLMARTLSTLIGSGVPMIEAIDIVSGLMSNICFKEALQEAKNEVTLGIPLSQSIENSGLFPPMVHHMLRIGEESGNTEEMLDKLADYYDEEVEMAVSSLMAAMEPMIIIVMALIVGVLIASVMAPMLTMYDALDNL